MTDFPTWNSVDDVLPGYGVGYVLIKAKSNKNDDDLIINARFDVKSACWIALTIDTYIDINCYGRNLSKGKTVIKVTHWQKFPKIL